MSKESIPWVGYATRRALHFVPLFFGIIVINFVLIHLAPGDPIDLLIGDAPVGEEFIKNLRALYGLDQPVHIQLLVYLKNVLTGSLGFSFYYNQPISDLIWSRIPATLLLMGTSHAIAFTLGIILGVASSRRPYSLTDNSITILGLTAYAIPNFWLAQLSILVFSLYLNLFPVSGITAVAKDLVGIEYYADVIHHLFLPAVTLAAWHLAVAMRLTRASMLEAMGQDFIITARAKGLRDRVVLYRHGLRNALLPIITVMGIYFGFMMSGSVVIETIFGWPGVGRLMFIAILRRDYNVVMGILVFVSTIVIIANLITDLLYAKLDPRIRLR